MPTYLSEVINQINYKANFGYTKPQLLNPTYWNDADACSKYSVYVRDHVKKVISVWFDNTGIETVEQYNPYVVPSTGVQVTHPDKLFLRNIAKNEFKVDSKILADIDNIIRAHDRSRYTADEFYPMANQKYSSRISEQPAEAYKISRIKHYHRNPHHLEYYVYMDYTRADGVPQTVDMPDVFLWELIADWLATPELTLNRPNGLPSPNPFVHFWGHECEFYWEPVYEDGEIVDYVKVYYTPVLPERVPMSYNTMNKIKNIVYRWEPPCPPKPDV